MSLEVRDFRGAGDPSGTEAAQTEALRAADESARLAKAGYTAVPQPYATLRTGYKIPLVGLGTWKSEKGVVGAAVVEAIRAGYRHIDCAAIYGNEEEVGEALAKVFAEGIVQRSDIFVTSKLWNSDHAAVRAACLKTLKDLQLDYLDLYLIHTWAALEGLMEEGLVRSIGLSNFSIKKIEAILETGRIPPAVLQIEAHPYWRNQELIDWANSRSIHVTAYSPLGSPDSAAIMRRAADTPNLMFDPTVMEIAGRIQKSPAQVLIRWAVQRGTSVLPKSTHPDRIRSNLAAVGFELVENDFEALSTLETQMRMVPGDFCVDPVNGPYHSREELWDE